MSFKSKIYRALATHLKKATLWALNRVSDADYERIQADTAKRKAERVGPPLQNLLVFSPTHNQSVEEALGALMGAIEEIYADMERGQRPTFGIAIAKINRTSPVIITRTSVGAASQDMTAALASELMELGQCCLTKHGQEVAAAGGWDALFRAAKALDEKSPEAGGAE